MDEKELINLINSNKKLQETIFSTVVNNKDFWKFVGEAYAEYVKHATYGLN